MHGKSALPSPLEKYSLQVKVEENGSKDLIIPFRNIQAEKARQWIENKISNDSSTESDSLLRQVRSIPEKITYTILLSSPYYTLSEDKVTIY